jgi:signal transduction histidine kinase
VRASAKRAATEGSLNAKHRFRGAAARSLELHAERFSLPDGRPLVAVAVADRVELEDRYAALIAAFSIAALLALLLVALGGYLLAGKSTAPVERSMAQMHRFMADAAHELRTPVAVLRTQAEVALQRDREPAEYRAALETTVRDAERLGGIVQNLLTLARVDAQEWPLRREKLFLDDLVPDAANAARLLADASKVQVDVSSLDEAPVEGDPALLRQLLLILLDNAVKYTPKGRVVIGVTQADGKATVAVEDTGVGIAAEQLPYVFERFFRGDPARGRTEGAGLGLAIARWIADVHGATLSIASRLGEGTRVTLTFPAAG